jgi:hypothetical protein
VAIKDSSRIEDEQGAHARPFLPFEGDRRPTRWERLRGELLPFWDTYFAIGAAVAVGILGLTKVTSETTTLSLILVVLAALAGSLHRDRSLREGLKGSVNNLENRLSVVSRALSNPLPYDVIRARYRWDFDAVGDVADVRKRARVRFVHNGVWTVLAWHTDIGNVHNAEAHRWVNDDKTHPLIVLGDLNLGDGHFGKLIGLDRKYGQNQVLDFEYRFQSRDNFPGDREWLNITIETFTADLTIEIVWPTGRIPDEVWLDEEGEPELALDEVEGRKVTTIKRENLVADQRISVRWRWQSTQQLREKDLLGKPAMGERTGQ